MSVKHLELVSVMKAKINRVTIQIVEGDLLTLKVAAIVNATTTDLALSPALIAKAGIELQRETLRIGNVDVASAVITMAGNLSGVERIIHAVGPRWGEGSERGKLANAVFECLRLAETNKLRSIALPAISIGANGYPVENCAKTMLTQIIDYTFEDLKHLRAVVLCLSDSAAAAIFRREFETQLADLKEEGDIPVQV